MTESVAQTTPIVEYKVCPSCGSEHLLTMEFPSKVERWSELEVIVCQDCGFGFVPRLHFDLNDYYANDYGKTHGRRNLKPSFFKTIDEQQTKKVARSRWHAKMLHDRFGEFDRVLDIGAGPGFFLHYIKAKRRFAIEYDTMSHPLLKRLKTQIIGSVDEINRVDLIVMSHTLEHFTVDTYRPYVDKLLTKLRPGGILLIEVPEFGFLNLNSAMPNDKGHEPHTLFFSPASLLKTVNAKPVYFHSKKHGYVVEDGVVNWAQTFEKEFPPSSMMGLWRKRGEPPAKRMRGLKPEPAPIEDNEVETTDLPTPTDPS
jgi:SAM-dependent methyltransferase